MTILRIFSHMALATLVLACGARPSLGPGVQSAERDAPLPQKEGAIGGEVRDAANGRPMSMVRLTASGKDGEVVATDISDYQGRYRIGPLAPGYYQVQASFSGARIDYEGIWVEGGKETDVKVQLDLRQSQEQERRIDTHGPAGHITGVVVESTGGQTFPGAVLALEAEHLDEAILIMSDGEGRFRFPNLRPGIYKLSCYFHLIDEGNVEVTRSGIEVRSGETAELQMVLNLRSDK